MLTEIVDLVRIFPHEFYKNSREIVEDKINEKFSDKIIPKIGLGLYMYDLLDASEGLIGHGDGLVNVNGLWLDCDIYADIFVPAHLLFQNTYFGKDDKDESGVEAWYWLNDGERLWMDVGEVVRARVEGEIWGDDKEADEEGGEGKVDGEMKTVENGDSAKTGRENMTNEMSGGWKIVCSMNGDGLGPKDWW
ncbi:MAG: hypothetical protein Q9160_004546 [Pyrenula sp. 1 TL-2023]